MTPYTSVTRIAMAPPTKPDFVPYIASMCITSCIAAGADDEQKLAKSTAKLPQLILATQKNPTTSTDTTTAISAAQHVPV